MILKDLIKKTNLDQIKLKFFELFPNEESVKPFYNIVFEELERLILLSKKSDMTICFRRDKYGFDVFGQNGTINEHTGKFETYALEFVPWEEWLEMKISEDVLGLYDDLSIICICIDEMTTLGLDQKVIYEEIEKIGKRIESIENGTAKLIPWEDVKRGILEKL